MNRLLRWFGGLALVALFAFSWLFQQSIADWWFLRSYQPSSEVVALADDSYLSDHGRRLFYLGDPKLLDKQEFNEKCVFSEFNIVLGCYSNGNIYVLRLEGELKAGELVTTAHEMLHGAYDRLSRQERLEIDRLVLDWVDEVTDELVLETLDHYKREKPESFVNEAHSVLGTEAVRLSLELEDYYGKYFNDRQALVEISQAYHQVFIDLEKQAKALAEQINDLADRANRESAQLALVLNSIDAQRIVIQSRVDAGETGPGIEAEINQFQIMVNSYNQRVRDYRQLQSRYTSFVDEYNSVALRHEELVKIIDSHFDEKQISD